MQKNRINRLNKGKSKLHYLRYFAEARKEIANVCEFGAQKYSKHNWHIGNCPVTEFIDSADRHLDSWLNKEDEDKESGLHHLAHAAWNIMAALELHITKKTIDDR